MAGDQFDRRRAAAVMAAARLDALVLFQPEHVVWASGLEPGPPVQFRRAGIASVIVPADPGAATAAVLPDIAAAGVRAAGHTGEVAYHPVWIDTDVARPHGSNTPLADVLASAPAGKRPAAYDPKVALGLLRDQLAARGLARARLGLDLGFVPAADLPLIEAALPGARLIDATDALRRIRMVKTPAEIARLRTAVELSEVGLAAAFAAVRTGVDQGELALVYGERVRAEARARRQPISGPVSYVSVGPDPWGAGRPAQAGDVVRFDVAVVIRGYSSDIARTVACGTPSRAARELHAALLAGLEAGLARLGPGVRLADVYATMLETVRARGVPGYARGHFGHGLGNDPFSEQWPFISADCDVAAEPGMVLAVEAPHYVEGLGGVIVEDQVLVTPAGIDIMSRLPRDFTVYG